MKLVLALLAAAGVAGYIYRKEILAKVQERIQLITTELDGDPEVLDEIVNFLKDPSSGTIWRGRQAQCNPVPDSEEA